MPGVRERGREAGSGATGAGVRQDAHAVEQFGRGPAGDEEAQPAGRTGEHGFDGGHNDSGLGHPPLALLAAGGAAGAGRHETGTPFLQPGDRGLRGRMGPHRGIHGGHEEQRFVALPCEQQRTGQIVGQAGGKTIQAVGRDGTDHDGIRPAHEIDVLERGSGGPEVRIRGLAGQALERRRTHKAEGGGGAHGAHLVAALHEGGNDRAGLRGGDGSGQNEEDFRGGHGQ